MEAALAGATASGLADGARDTLAGAVALAKQLPDGDAARLLAAARGAYVEAFTVTAALCAIIALAGAAIALISLDRGQPGEAVRAESV
jgi:DHA2 family multidrug resistance protein-like MFS transporter